ncbi:ankyrin repeat-containing domain protein, partial [Coprinopsis sp. MPI-PUGE-AT-0042]
ILINAADKDGVTPLIRAVKWKNTAGVALLLAHPQVHVNAQDRDGESALMRAFSAEEVTLLLSHPKIRPNQVNSRGRTALMLASLRELPEVVQVLLADARVKIDLKSKDGETALDIAQGR